MATPYSPIVEHEQEGYDYEEEEQRFSTNGCNCFQVFSFKWMQNHENENKNLLNQKGASGFSRETWVVKKLKKVKEASEVVAGPKWKTFIRKISFYFKKQRNFNNNNNNNQFQYDPESYALNFDNGGIDREEDELLLPVFSSRLAVPSSVNEKHQNGL